MFATTQQKPLSAFSGGGGPVRAALRLGGAVGDAIYRAPRVLSQIVRSVYAASDASSGISPEVTRSMKALRAYQAWIMSCSSSSRRGWPCVSPVARNALNPWLLDPWEV